MASEDIKKRRNGYSVQKSLGKYFQTPNKTLNSPENVDTMDFNVESQLFNLQTRLDKNWLSLQKISCYQHKKKNIFCGLIHNLDVLSTEMKINANFKNIGVDFDREKFLKLIEQHENQIVVYFNNYYYDFLHIGEMCRILENKIKVQQNLDGQLLGSTIDYFAIISPIELN